MTAVIWLESSMLPGQRREILVVPGAMENEDPTIYTRRMSSPTQVPWKKSYLSQVSQTLPPSEKTTKILALAITPEEASALVDNKVPASLAARALAEETKVPVPELGSVREDLGMYHEAIAEANEADISKILVGTLAGPIKKHITVQFGMQAPASSQPAPSAPAVSQQKSAPVQQSSATGNPIPIADTGRVAWVPNKMRARNYKHRQVKGVEDFAVLDFAHAESINVLLTGPTGSGKSYLAEAWAAHNSKPLAVVSGNVAVEPSELFGKIVPMADGSVVFVRGPVTDVVEFGGVLVLDEVNFFSNRITPALYTLLRERRITLPGAMGQTIHAHDDLLIVGTMNEGYVGTHDLNQAFSNRFQIQLEWGYDERTERALGIKPAVLDLARKLRAEASLMSPTPTDALMHFQRYLQKFGFDFAVEAFITRYHADDREAVRMAMAAMAQNIKSAFTV